MSDKDSPPLCDDLRNVTEGDDVTLTTDDEGDLRATCISRSKHNDPDPEKVREYTTLNFEQEGAECIVQITDGLKSFEWETPYPRHTPLYDEDNKVTLGYITGVKIHGKMEN